MSTFKVKLVRPTKHVMLEMTEPTLPLTKGTWKRLPADSNSKLRYESAEWENWILGSPGGGRNLRLYDPSNTKSAVLREFVDGASEGDAEFLLDDFGGDFGGEPCRWYRF
jgi:hypothetical protein